MSIFPALVCNWTPPTDRHTCLPLELLTPSSIGAYACRKTYRPTLPLTIISRHPRRCHANSLHSHVLVVVVDGLSPPPPTFPPNSFLRKLLCIPNPNLVISASSPVPPPPRLFPPPTSWSTASPSSVGQAYNTWEGTHKQSV